MNKDIISIQEAIDDNIKRFTYRKELFEWFSNNMDSSLYKCKYDIVGFDTITIINPSSNSIYEDLDFHLIITDDNIISLYLNLNRELDNKLMGIVKMLNIEYKQTWYDVDYQKTIMFGNNPESWMNIKLAFNQLFGDVDAVENR